MLVYSIRGLHVAGWPLNGGVCLLSISLGISKRFMPILQKVWVQRYGVSLYGHFKEVFERVGNARVQMKGPATPLVRLPPIERWKSIEEC